jgi:hypothetical protein
MSFTQRDIHLKLFLLHNSSFLASKSFSAFKGASAEQFTLEMTAM